MLPEQLELPLPPVYHLWTDETYFVVAESLDDAIEELGFDPDEEENRYGWRTLSTRSTFSCYFSCPEQAPTEDLRALLVENVLRNPEEELMVELPVATWLEICPPGFFAKADDWD